MFINLFYSINTIYSHISYKYVSDFSDDVIIGKNTEQLCNCIVGMTCKANIELVNRGNKWITCTLNLSEVRGDQQSIVLSIPEDAVLIKPNCVQSTKVIL